MSKVLIQKFDGNPVLDLIGVAKARLVPQRHQPSSYLLTMEGVRQVCETGKKQGVFDDEQIAAILSDCEAMGMKPNLQAVLDAVVTVEVPAELAGDYEFVVCTECEIPVAHGHISWRGRPECGPFLSFEDGLNFLSGDDQETITPAEAAHLLKKMATTLLIDMKAVERAIEALTPEQMTKVLGLPAGIEEFLGEILGGVKVSVRTIRL